jgi:hypothetical protein
MDKKGFSQIVVNAVLAISVLILIAIIIFDVLYKGPISSAVLKLGNFFRFGG